MTLVALLVSAGEARAETKQTVDIGVFSLFRPTELTLYPPEGGILIVHTDRDEVAARHAAPLHLSLNGYVGGPLDESLDRPILRIDSAAGVLLARRIVARPASPEALWTLSVPGRIERRYRGRLVISVQADHLEAVVTMERETAVASIVAAESPPGAPLEALKAQAVVARSYLVASRGKHARFDSCDTTHCQFLREPPPPDDPAALAAQATRGMVLEHAGKTIAAMYSSSCGGATTTPRQLGVEPRGYPYYAVECPRCRDTPDAWSRDLTIEQARPLLTAADAEAARIQVNRKLGWSAVPSNRYRVERGERTVTLRGSGVGHGIGLCQKGAAYMAAAEESFRGILRLYFPNTLLSGALNGRRHTRFPATERSPGPSGTERARRPTAGSPLR